MGLNLVYAAGADIKNGSITSLDCANPVLRPDGGAEGVRTPDLLNAIQALYQLSYDPIRSDGKCKTCPNFVKTQIQFLLFAVPTPAL